jgi:microcystin-dependent protein
MADTLRIKRRAAGGAAGPPSSLAAAELAYNEQDDTLYYGKGNSAGLATSIVAIGGPSVLAAPPVGLVAPYAGVTAPAKWLLCAGQNVSRTTYAALWTALSTNYGVGDGSTTFGIPDLRGRVAAGKNDMGGSNAGRLNNNWVASSGNFGVNGNNLGNAGGLEYHVLKVSELEPHSHTVGYDANIGAQGGFDYFTASGTTPRNNTSAVGGSAAHNNTQPTLILNYIIYAGV